MCGGRWGLHGFCHDVGGGGGGGCGRDGCLGEHSGGVPRAAPQPLVLVLRGGVVDVARGCQDCSSLDRKVDPLPLLPLTTPSERDPKVEGHVETYGLELHTPRVAAQVEPAQRPDANAVWHWAKGFARERAPGAPVPSLAISPLGALVFAVPANLAPHEAAKDPLKGHMRVRRARKEGLILCAALLEGLCRPRH